MVPWAHVTVLWQAAVNTVIEIRVSLGSVGFQRTLFNSFEAYSWWTTFCCFSIGHIWVTCQNTNFIPTPSGKNWFV